MSLIPQMYCISVYVLYIHLCFIQRTRFFSPLQSSNFKPLWKCICISVLCSVALLCLTLCNTLDCSPPGSSVHGIFQPRILEWVAISSSRRSSWPRNWAQVSWSSCIGRQILYHWVTWEASVLLKIDFILSFYRISFLCLYLACMCLP